MESQFDVFFSPLFNLVYEWVEWMWRMSKQSRVDVENDRVEWMWTISDKKILRNTLLCCCF